ncbi:hypothetical protein [Bradyrhizobium sp. WSM3983]|uniref:hypothetical protein n=1 Tax=Bradyrhizobium sp. WSM3983 TaxID=1038867 RepID=UPI0012EB51D7|nr:hypothetical protein [Bradyrhizobium sp. WSM3983]
MKGDGSQLFDDWFDPIESAVRERAWEFIDKAGNGWCDHRSAIENCISLNGFPKFRQMLPHTFQRSFRREPLAGHSSTRKKGLDLPQRLAQPGFDRHRQGSVDSRSTPIPPRGKRSLSPNGLSSTLRLARDYEKGIDVVHAMILVAMSRKRL